MFGFNSLRRKQNESVENAPSNEVQENVPDNKELDKKLGGVANAQIASEKASENKKLLHVNDGEALDNNLRSMNAYLKDAGINTEFSEKLLASGLFDLAGDGVEYRLSMWNSKDENGEPYLRSSFRDELGHSRPSGHIYKVFQRGELLAVYDSAVKTESRHYVMDETPGDEDANSSNDFQIDTKRVSLMEPSSGEIVARGDSRDEHMIDGPAKNALFGVNNENLDEDLKKFDFKVENQEKFEQLGGSSIIG